MVNLWFDVFWFRCLFELICKWMWESKMFISFLIWQEEWDAQRVVTLHPMEKFKETILLLISLNWLNIYNPTCFSIFFFKGSVIIFRLNIRCGTIQFKKKWEQSNRFISHLTSISLSKFRLDYEQWPGSWLRGSLGWCGRNHSDWFLLIGDSNLMII